MFSPTFHPTQQQQHCAREAFALTLAWIFESLLVFFHSKATFSSSFFVCLLPHIHSVLSSIHFSTFLSLSSFSSVYIRQLSVYWIIRKWVHSWKMKEIQFFLLACLLAFFLELHNRPTEFFFLAKFQFFSPLLLLLAAVLADDDDDVERAEQQQKKVSSLSTKERSRMHESELREDDDDDGEESGNSCKILMKFVQWVKSFWRVKKIVWHLQ